MQEDMQVAPVNATVSEYDKNDGFTVVKEVMGTKIDRDVLKEGVMSAIEGVLDEYLSAQALLNQLPECTT